MMTKIQDPYYPRINFKALELLFGHSPKTGIKNVLLLLLLN